MQTQRFSSQCLVQQIEEEALKDIEQALTTLNGNIAVEFRPKEDLAIPVFNGPRKQQAMRFGQG